MSRLVSVYGRLLEKQRTRAVDSDGAVGEIGELEEMVASFVLKARSKP